MPINTDVIIEKLQKIFPTKIIYEEQYIKQAGVSLTFEIHKQAKLCYQTYIQWLTANGFTWKETGYIEPDMRMREVAEETPICDAFAIADFVFRKYPLA